MKTIGHLKVNGRPFQPRTSPAEERLKEFIQSLPDDEVLQHWPLTKAGGFSSATVYASQSELVRSGLCLVSEHGRRRMYYGNKRAIEALKALLAQSKP